MKHLASILVLSLACATAPPRSVEPEPVVSTRVAVPMPVDALRAAAIRLRVADAGLNTETVPAPTRWTPAAAAALSETVLEYLATQRGEPLNWSVSIVDLLKLVGLDSSVTARHVLAVNLGYQGPLDDSAEMNDWLRRQIMEKYVPSVPVLPRVGMRAPGDIPVIVPPRRILWGTSYEDDKPATEEQMGAFRLIGFDLVRPTVRIYQTNPSQNVFDWSSFERTLDMARIVGLQVIPTLHWIPAWMSGGVPTYEEYTRGCTRWKAGAQTVFDIEFAADVPYCANPPHLDTAALQRYGAAFGLKFGRRLMAVTVGNEFGGRIYWPPMFSDSDSNDAAERAVVEFIEPVTRGIRTFCPTMQFIGPESDGADIHRRILESERAHGLELFNAISAHPYPTSTDWRSVFVLLDGFDAAAVATRGDRAQWYSESGGMPDILVFIREVLASGRNVSMISIGDFRQWFVPGSWEANRPVLNARGIELQAFIRAANAGRPMRSHI